MRRVREFLLGNWRNKGVALFFAFAIWVVAFQSEKQELHEDVRIEFRPEDPSARVITELRAVAGEAEAQRERPFDGRVQLGVSGPRKRIEQLRQMLAFGRHVVEVRVPPEKELFHRLEQADFAFARAGTGLTITSISPPGVRIVQDELATVKIENLASRVDVADRGGNDVGTVRVEPNEALITGPKSVIDSIVLSIVYSAAGREQSRGLATVEVRAPDETSQGLMDLVHVVPPEVMVEVTLREQVRSLVVDAVRIMFTVEPPRFAFKILTDDLVDGRIPVEFYGPKVQIDRLEAAKDDPGFALSVRVPRIESTEETIVTFTEESLELRGFEGVQMRRPASLREEKKGAPWTYQIVPVVPSPGD